MERIERDWARERDPSLPGQAMANFTARSDRARPAAREWPPVVVTHAGKIGAPTLPAQPTPLIGRDRDVAAVVALLRDPEVRLVTLSGAGGVGKTRLALAVGDALRADFPDGVWWVDLSAVRDPARVLPHVAAALGLSPTDTLRDGLRGRAGLLLLDNCEQVKEVAPALAELLAECQAVRILATSRMPLLVRWEREWPVQPLATADPALLSAPEELVVVPSVALFLDRLAAVQPDFALNQASAQTVAAICSRLDGLPLALELAAALTRSLPLPALLARLSAGSPLDVLTGGPRDLPDRHRTLRDAIAWSYDLLDEPARRAFRRFGIFAGGWDAEAALAVAGANQDAGLVEASLARTAPDLTGRERYALLATVREYALERLRDAGEGAETAERHAAHYLDLAERAAQELTGPGQAAWLARLDAERDNLDDALAWALRHRGTIALRLLSALGHYHFRRGNPSGSGELVEAALGQATDADPRLHAAILPLAARWALRAGDRARLTALAERADRIDGPGADPASAAHASVTRALAALARNDNDDALRRFDACARAYLLAGDRARAARQYLAAGNAAWRGGDRASIARCWEQALTLGGEAGDGYAVACARVNLATLAFAEGDLARAEELARRADEWFAASGDAVGMAMAQHTLGMLAAATDDHLRAERLLRASLQGWARLGSARRLALGLQSLAALAARSGQHERAARLFAAGGARWARLGQCPPPLLWSLLERDLDAVREQLSAATFHRAWTAGRELTDEEILLEALGGAGRPVPAAPVVVPKLLAQARAPQRLTDRQRGVAGLVALGQTNREIANRLSISERTVDAHIQDILERLGFNSRAQIASWVATNGREQHGAGYDPATQATREAPEQHGARP